MGIGCGMGDLNRCVWDKVRETITITFGVSVENEWKQSGILLC